jgi:hypothetical protein
MTNWYPECKQVTIGVVVNNKEEREKYFRLFKLMLSDNISSIKKSNDVAIIEADKFRIDFITVRNQNTGRGWRRHYILNLTQDKEFDEMCVQPKTSIFDYLKHDPKWSELFSD